MERILHFVSSPRMRRFSISGEKIEIKITPEVFPPSNHGCCLAKQVNVQRGERVIDIGTGTGILAILAAKKEAKVFATDTSGDAINLARENAKINNVNIDLREGPYFANHKTKFDVIIANLPQEIVHTEYQETIGKKLSKTCHGKKSGNFYLLEFLNIAPEYMHKKTRIYTIVYTLSNYKESLEKICKEFDARLLDFESAPTKEFVKDNINFYKKLNATGKIRIFPKNNKWFADEYIFELTLKNNTFP